MQQRGKSGVSGAARLQGRTTSWVELLWTRGRQAGLLLACEGHGVVRGVTVAPLRWNIPCFGCFTAQAGGQCPREQVGASERFLKTGLVIPIYCCSCSSDLLQHSSPKDTFALPREDQAVSILGGEEDRDGSRTEPWGPACIFLGAGSV